MSKCIAKFSAILEKLIIGEKSLKPGMLLDNLEKELETIIPENTLRFGNGNPRIEIIFEGCDKISASNEDRIIDIIKKYTTSININIPTKEIKIDFEYE